MTQINPFSGVVVNAHVQRQQGVARQRQIRRMQNLNRNAALRGDELEHQVESADALHPINDQGGSNNLQRRPEQHQRQRQDNTGEGESEHMDLRV